MVAARFASPGEAQGKAEAIASSPDFGGANLPVFLLTVFGKGEKSNLTKAERNGFASLIGTLAEAYRQKVVNMGSAR